MATTDDELSEQKQQYLDFIDKLPFKFSSEEVREKIEKKGVWDGIEEGIDALGPEKAAAFTAKRIMSDTDPDDWG